MTVHVIFTPHLSDLFDFHERALGTIALGTSLGIRGPSHGGQQVHWFERLPSLDGQPEM
jgi:hypothetical protein